MSWCHITIYKTCLLFLTNVRKFHNLFRNTFRINIRVYIDEKIFNKVYKWVKGQIVFNLIEKIKHLGWKHLSTIVKVLKASRP